MDKFALFCLFAVCGLNKPVLLTRINIANNGYTGIVVTLPSDVADENRPRLVSALNDVFQESYSLLRTSTKGRATFRDINVIVPATWGDIGSWASDVGPNVHLDLVGQSLYRCDADISVTGTSAADDQPFTLHQSGCGRHGLRIYLPTNFLLNGSVRQRSLAFVRLWAEYRYGVFPENGFENDMQYPVEYEVPGEMTKRLTGCSDDHLRHLNDCDGNFNCTEGESYISLMDQHSKDKDTFFCEGQLGFGPRHNAESPSKHNLMCSDAGAWFTVLRNPDFAQGKNAVPKQVQEELVTLRLVKEATYVRAVVAIDISSRMSKQNRYELTKNAFSRFVTSDLPAGSELDLLLFEGENVITVPSFHIGDELTRVQYLEGQPMPEEPTITDSACPDCALSSALEVLKSKNDSSGPTPTVILVTTFTSVSRERYQILQQELQNIRLIVLLFKDGDSIHSNDDTRSHYSLYDLCSVSDNRLVSLEIDALGNLYRGFGNAMSESLKNVEVHQEYLPTLDGEDIQLNFNVDKSLSGHLRVHLSGPEFSSLPLEQDKTVLLDSNKNPVVLKKEELTPAWLFQVQLPQEGEYVLKTRRKEGATSPVLLTVTATHLPNVEPISVNVWVEAVESKILPPPVRILAEIRQGQHPVRSANVVAYVQHASSDHVSEIRLIDDGKGSVDITSGDGIYSHFFTNFTTTGLYSVYANVTGSLDDLPVLSQGPSSPCCGTAFPSRQETPINHLQRGAGPVTFQVSALPAGDPYPPARVTDLRMVRAYEGLCALQWTAVGDNYDEGVASAYQLKLFADRSTMRNRFHGSESELLRKTIEATSPATYGKVLYHVTQLPLVPVSGIYYFSVRAIDVVGNAGEPSNAVPLWLNASVAADVVDCEEDQPVAAGLNSGASRTFVMLTRVFLYTLVMFFSSGT